MFGPAVMHCITSCWSQHTLEIASLFFYFCNTSKISITSQFLLHGKGNKHLVVGRGEQAAVHLTEMLFVVLDCSFTLLPDCVTKIIRTGLSFNWTVNDLMSAGVVSRSIKKAKFSMLF